IEFVRFQQDLLTHCKISLTQNKDGTTTTSWKYISTALSEKGNKEIDSRHVENKRFNAIIKMIDHYLKTGKNISKLSLSMKMVHGHQ
ncbi:MAG: hypothetical protein WBH31_07570, partial [Promethearchaeia archaeon]